MIRVERMNIADTADDNALELPLLTSMYLGDRWEYLFRTEVDNFALRAYGKEFRGNQRFRISLPKEDLWIFAKS